ncbi:hypothetical protein QTN25_002279 [Entamoeba marina]
MNNFSLNYNPNPDLSTVARDNEGKFASLTPAENCGNVGRGSNGQFISLVPASVSDAEKKAVVHQILPKSNIVN